jgi:hypothetical protein
MGGFLVEAHESELLKQRKTPIQKDGCFLAEQQGFDLIIVALRLAVARHSPPDCGI